LLDKPANLARPKRRARQEQKKKKKNPSLVKNPDGLSAGKEGLFLSSLRRSAEGGGESEKKEKTAPER